MCFGITQASKKGTLQDHLIAIPVTKKLLDHAESWTMGQITGIGDNVSDFIGSPTTQKWVLRLWNGR